MAVPSFARLPTEINMWPPRSNDDRPDRVLLLITYTSRPRSTKILHKHSHFQRTLNSCRDTYYLRVSNEPTYLACRKLPLACSALNPSCWLGSGMRCLAAEAALVARPFGGVEVPRPGGPARPGIPAAAPAPGGANCSPGGGMGGGGKPGGRFCRFMLAKSIGGYGD